MSSDEFVADDARLAKMHGYAPMTDSERLARLEAQLDTLETMVRVLTIALRSGAVGRWQNP